MFPGSVKRQTTRHLRQAATNLPANEDTSSFAFRVAGRTNFAVPRSPAATLIVIYDRGYFPCARRIHLLFAYRSTGLYEIANGPTDTPPQGRGHVRATVIFLTINRDTITPTR